MSLRTIATLQGHTDRAWHVSWSPSTPLLATCSSDKSLRFYTYTPTSPSHFSFSSSIPTAHPRTVRSISFSPTGQTLASASFDSTVGIWSLVNEHGLDDGAAPPLGAGGDWESADPLEGHESECKSAEWSSDGRLLASCSRDKSVWVWEAVSPTEFECLAVLMEHSQDVKCVTWHPTDELLASASYDDSIKLYAADPYDDEWSCISTLLGHSSTVWSISFSPCGDYLASTGDDLSIKLWQRISKASKDAEMGEVSEAKREEGGRMGPWSRGGVRIGMKERWEWREVATIARAHERTVYSLDWKKGGLGKPEGGLGRIVTAGGDGTINVFQILAPTGPNAPPTHRLVASVESAHGVSDVNHVSWCTLSPSKAAATLLKLEGGDDEDQADQNEDGQDDEAMPEAPEMDSRWKGVENMFASAGDDGVVKVWVVEP